jgi:predicted RNase H-like HicB family nuclease
MLEQEVHGVVFKDAPSGQWVAMCLEYDVVTQGDSEDHAFEMLKEAVEIHLAGIDPLELEQSHQPVDSEPVTRRIRVRAPALLH